MKKKNSLTFFNPSQPKKPQPTDGWVATRSPQEIQAMLSTLETWLWLFNKVVFFLLFVLFWYCFWVLLFFCFGSRALCFNFFQGSKKWALKVRSGVRAEEMLFAILASCLRVLLVIHQCFTGIYESRWSEWSFKFCSAEICANGFAQDTDGDNELDPIDFYTCSELSQVAHVFCFLERGTAERIWFPEGNDNPCFKRLLVWKKSNLLLARRG